MSKQNEGAGKYSSEVISVENNRVRLAVHLSGEYFREGLDRAHNRHKGQFNIPGFRKGKAPRAVLQQHYGQELYHEEAFNYCLPDAYEHALDTHGLEPVYKPDVEATEVSEKGGVTFRVEFDTMPEAAVENYIGLPYPKASGDVSADEVHRALQAEREKNARRVSVGRKAQPGDVVTINFKGYMDGEPFDGGTGQDHDLHLGSGRFIPGFEEQLVGFGAGDKATVSVTFPEKYQHEPLAGKDATFEVEILDVQERQLPELDDEFAETVSEFDTIEEYREHVREKIRKHKESSMEIDKQNYVVRKLAEMTRAEVPESMYLARLDDYFDEFAVEIRRRGMDVQNYMRFSDISEESLKNSWRPRAELDVMSSLALMAIAAKENFSVGPDEVRARIAESMPGKSDDEVEKHISEMPRRQMRDIEKALLRAKAYDFVMEKAVAAEGLEPEALDLDEVLGN